MQDKRNSATSDRGEITRFREMIDDALKSLDLSVQSKEQIHTVVQQLRDQLSKLSEDIEADIQQTEGLIAENDGKIRTLKDSIKSILVKQDRAAELDDNNKRRKELLDQKLKLKQFLDDKTANSQEMATIEKNIKSTIKSLLEVGLLAETQLSSTVITSDLKIHAKFGFDFKKYTDNILGKVDGRKLGKVASLGLPESIDFDTNTFDELWTALIIRTMRGDLSSYLNKANRTEDMIENEIHLPLHIPLDIEKDNDLLRTMSPGKRAIVVLELLLNDEDTDKSPILIDQPEDNLDNRSISTELVSLLRRVSVQRQVIMVTHNANLVVLSDADEVIVANQDVTLTENRYTKFEYYSGSLENSVGVTNDDTKYASRGIRENITDILEGGVEAFEEREKKYLLK